MSERATTSSYSRSTHPIFPFSLRSRLRSGRLPPSLWQPLSDPLTAFNTQSVRPAPALSRGLFQYRSAHPTAQLLLVTPLTIPLQAHYDLCRSMKYRKIAAGAVVVRKDSPANRLLILLSGTLTLLPPP